MRDNTKAFCRVVAESFDCPGPIYEFGSYQTRDQVDYADLRGLFPGRRFVGCDLRAGPGVDRIADVSDIDLDDESVGTVLAIETFEHVFEVRRAFDEVFRVLRPGGIFIVTLPLNFRLHGFPDDFWRMTPTCLRRMMAPYAARLTGSQGYHRFPHTVLGVGVKDPIPVDAGRRLERVSRAFQGWLRQAEADLPFSWKIRRRFRQVYRSKGERLRLRHHFRPISPSTSPRPPSRRHPPPDRPESGRIARPTSHTLISAKRHRCRHQGRNDWSSWGSTARRGRCSTP